MNYFRYWLGSAINLLGSALSTIAYPLLVISMGGSAAQAGMVGSVSLITRTIFRLPGGHICDLMSARTLMIITDVVRMIAVGSIPAVALSGGMAYPQLLVVALVEGVATALYAPAYTVMLRDLVSTDKLTGALSQAQATTGTVLLLGPLAGGVIFAFDHTLPFALDAASYAVSFLLLLTVTAPRRTEPGERPDRRASAGLRWLWQQPSLLRVLLFAGVVNLVAGALDVPILISLRDQGRSSAVFGAVLAAAGAGLIIGAVLAKQVLALLRTESIYLLVGVLWAGGTAALIWRPGPWLMAAILVVLLALSPAASIKLSQLTLARVPHQLIGRVTTAQGTVTAGLSSLGPGLAGFLLVGLGLGGTFLVLALLCVLATGITLIRGAAPALDAQSDSEVLAHGSTAEDSHD